LSEFKSRRELREAERQGLVAKPEQVFDLPTGQIQLPEQQPQDARSHAIAPVGEMLTRRKMRELEREGLLDPLTGSIIQVNQSPDETVETNSSRAYDEVLAETEEPITSTIIVPAAAAPTAPAAAPAAPAAAPAVTPIASAAPAPDASARIAPAPVDGPAIFHSMAVDVSARKPRIWFYLALIVVVLGGLGFAAYMLGIFK
jgi:hypothetical protein